MSNITYQFNVYEVKWVNFFFFQIMPDYYAFQHRKVAKRSIYPSSYHHRSIVQEANVSTLKSLSWSIIRNTANIYSFTVGSLKFVITGSIFPGFGSYCNNPSIWRKYETWSYKHYSIMKIYKTMSQQICKIYITDNPRKFAPTNLYDSTVCTSIQYPSYLMT